MQVDLLGPLEVAGPDGRVRVGGAKERLVVALLALRSGEVVSRDALVDSLWGDDPPATAVKTLQGYVARVRRALEAGGMADVLGTRDPGYVLCVPADSIDVHCFERHATSGRGALAGGDATRAMAELGAALGLWRGDALADCRGGGWAAAHAVRLDELRLSTVEDRIDAELMLAHHGVLVGELESLVARHPLRERLWGQLMVALYRSGRQADAVRAYQRARDVVGELGLEPGPELRRLEAAVLAGEPALDAPVLVSRDAELAIPLPGRVGAASSAVFVGRAHERERLDESLKAVAAGERRVVLVSGEPGIGKTALSATFARQAFDNGACVLFGRCEEDLATPYQLFSEALGHYVTHAFEDHLAGHVAAHGSELVRLVPALASTIPDLPPSKATDTDAERFLLFAAAVGLLAMASAHQPVVLVFDDLQWADRASLLLLRHLIASELPMRVLIIGTYRDSELSQASALRETLGLLRRSDGVSRIELTGLDDTGVMAYLEAASGHALEGPAVGLAHAVYRETDGNPFFVTEVLRHLAETGAISQDAAGRWVTADGLDVMALPDSVREVIGGRVVRLGPDAERVLSMAAVIGRDFDLDVLARATQTPEDDLLDVLDAAATVSLVRELVDAPGRYSFAHALIQHTLYEDLGPNRQARAHRHVAGALEDLCGDAPGTRVGELARHWCSATQPIDLAKAVSYSRLAADAALAALAPADALGYYAQALDLFARSEDFHPVFGVDLAIGLGTAQRQTGNPAFRDTLLDAAHRAADLGDLERLVAAALANYRGWHTSAGAVDADKVEILEMALARLPADRPERALVLATLCSELAHGSSLERRQALADEAIAIAESSGDDTIMVRVLNQVFISLFVPSQLERSWGRTADALVRAERVGDPVLLFFAAWWRAEAAGRGGDIDEMDRCYAISGSLAEQLDQPTLNWANTFTRAMRAQIAGDPDQIEQLATEALHIGTDSGQPDAAFHFGVSLARARWQRGTLGERAQRIELAVADNPAVRARSFLAMAYVEGDRTEDATNLLEEFAAAEFDLALDSYSLIGMVEYAEAAIECRAAKYAGLLFDRLAPWADQLATAAGAVAEGPVSHYLGGLATVLGRYDEADAYFTQAAAMNNRMSATFFAARTHLLWGRMLAERTAPGETEKARDLLTRATTAATAHGYATVARRADEALQHLD